MIQGLIGKKVGMTHLFSDDAQVVPVTVLEVGPCVVTQVRTPQRDGYEAVQIGYGHAKQLNKPQRGHLRRAGTDVRVLREFEADDVSQHEIGQRLQVTLFQPGDIVDVTSRSKGRGFQGAVKRHGFGGGRKTHGQGDRYRAVGSIGAGTFPGRVYKGKKMPGHMGNEQVTARKLRVERVDPARNLLMVRGAVPGARNAVVTVRYAKGIEVAQRLTDQEWADLLGTMITAPEPGPEVEAAEDEAQEQAAPEVPVDEATAEEPEASTAEAEPAEEAAEEPEPPEEIVAEETAEGEEESATEAAPEAESNEEAAEAEESENEGKAQ